MKNWVKENIVNIIGNFFIWIVPLIMVLIMSFGGTRQETSTTFKVSIWGIVVAIIYLLVYRKKIKKEIDRRKTIQLANLGYVKVWVRLIEWLSYLLPYVIALVLIVGLKGVYEQLYDELVLFIVLVMISATLGYIVLGIDTKYKSANIKE